MVEEGGIKTEELYNINPDDLESGFLEVSKLFFKLAGTTAAAYMAYLDSKNDVKRITARVFLDIKKDPNLPKVPSDGVAKEFVEVHADVLKVRAELNDKIREWEKLKAAKETLLTKKEMLSAISYNRKLEYDVEKSR